MTDPKVCDRREADCACARSGRHTIHRCDCGGAWVYNSEGNMVPRTFPDGETNLWRALDRMFDPFAGLFR